MNDFYSTFLIVIGLIAIVVFIIHNILFEIIKKRSKTYKNLKTLNKKYKFKKDELVKQIPLFEKCTNRRTYDTAIIDDYLEKSIHSKIKEFDELIDKNEAVRQQFKSYIKEYNTLLPEKLSNISNFKLKEIKSWIYNFYENLIFKTYKQKPLRYTKARVKISYRSPQGKVNIEKSHTYSYDALKKHYDYVKKSLANKTAQDYLIRYERSLVTNALRAKILKRDKYRCQQCGRMASDEVSLHVDHKKPISKGGKTEESNLQILCEDCNRTKSNKENYDM